MSIVSLASQVRKYRPLVLKDILKIANQVKRRYMVNGGLDLQVIAEGEGIHIFKNSIVTEKYKLKSYENAKIYNDPSQKPFQWMIVYDDRRSYEKYRYSIAHELGHYFLDHRAVFYETGITTDPEREEQANLFAMCLLMRGNKV